MSKEMIGATSIPLILSILNEGESYGYQIIQRMKAVSNDQIEWKEGTLYPILHKMEKKGLITSFWKVSDNGRKRKYYRIVEEGKSFLSLEMQNWQSMNQIISKLWQTQVNSI